MLSVEPKGSPLTLNALLPEVSTVSMWQVGVGDRKGLPFEALVPRLRDWKKGYT